MNSSDKTRLSHELMTQLHHVLGMAQLIQCEADDDKRKDYFDTLMGAGEDLKQKIKVLIESSDHFDLEKILKRMSDERKLSPRA